MPCVADFTSRNVFTCEIRRHHEYVRQLRATIGAEAALPTNLTHVQTRTVESPAAGSTSPRYRVSSRCPVASGISPAVFVFEQATDQFSHVATPGDLLLYPASALEARERGTPYYRGTEVVRDFESLRDANSFAETTTARVQSLVDGYAPLVAEFVGSDTYTVTPST